MRYFRYENYTGEGFYADVVSEEDIREDFYPQWYEKMCDLLGKEKADAECTFDDCIDHFIEVYEATEIDFNPLWG